MIIWVHKRIGWLSIPLLMIFLTACGLMPGNLSESSIDHGNDFAGGYPVDPLFIEFYTTLGNTLSLGPALTPLRQEGVILKQYVYAGLLLYDPRATESDRFHLAPLGRSFSVETPAVENLYQANTRYINGHIIQGNFLKLYDALGGARIVGKPLSEEHYNSERLRYEQYFENLGFYRLDDDPTGPLLLMAYGAVACGNECDYPLHDEAAIPSSLPLYTEPFNKFILHLCGQVTGQALTGLVPGEDGRLMIIFENLVVVADRTIDQRVNLHPIAIDAGILPGEFETPDKNLLNEFIEVDENLGFNVPDIFMDFLLELGGLDFSGLPVTSVTYVSEGLYQQCFTNLCLRFQTSSDAKDGLKRHISLAPLGQQYKERVYDRLHDFSSSQSLDDVEVRVWEKKESINKREMQTITAAIFERGIPLTNREPILQLTYPDLTVFSIYMPPTDSNGQTSLVLPPIKAPNNTMIFYQVCLYGFNNDESVCVKDHYTIWNEP